MCHSDMAVTNISFLFQPGFNGSNEKWIQYSELGAYIVIGKVEKQAVSWPVAMTPKTRLKVGLITFFLFLPVSCCQFLSPRS